MPDETDDTEPEYPPEACGIEEYPRLAPYPELPQVGEYTGRGAYTRYTVAGLQNRNPYGLLYRPLQGTYVYMPKYGLNAQRLERVLAHGYDP